MFDAVAIYDEYIRRLKTITKANGYSSDAGNQVLEGWLASAVVDEKDMDFPVLLIQPISDDEDEKSAGGRLRLTARFQVLVCERVGDGVSKKLMNHAKDLRNALADRNNFMQLGGKSIKSKTGNVQYEIPEDGFPIAFARIELSADYILELDYRNEVKP